MSSDITGISSMATRQILTDLSRRYEDRTGTAVAIRPMGGVDAAQLVRAGETTDVVILASGVMAKLEAEGHVAAGTIVNFASSGMAIAVRAGATKPDIGNAEAVKQAVLKAGKVSYSTGPSGDHLLQLCEQWGISGSMAERLIKAPPGIPVGKLVAEGEADLGFQQLSELLGLARIDIVGPLPPDIQSTTIFAAGVCKTSSRPEETAALISYRAAAEADDVKRKYGMEPA
jgi:molybdate transport system substrate-binding protein